jgi:hypothetical protein
MAYTTFEYSSVDNNGNLGQQSNNAHTITLSAGQSEQLALPDASYVTEADMLKDGFDLVLQTPDGSVIVENYFAQDPPPLLVAPDGKTLTPDLVESFAHSAQEYADANLSTSDVSPVGAVQEISGEAHVIRANGKVEVIGVGTHIFQGDIVETEGNGAVNIMFIDETTFAISEDARLAIDEYVFDPATQSGTTNFSVLKGVFVFTSGLIGREDPDDVMIDTPSGSIGIRGTIIAGNVNNGEITVIEGAIVLHDFNGNTITLSNQYETARFDISNQTIEYMGELAAEDVSDRFTSVSNVSGSLFSSIEDSTAELNNSESQNSEETDQTNTEDAEVKTEAQVEQDNAPESTSEETLPTPESTVITSDEITGSNVEDFSSIDTSSNSTQEPPAPENTINTTPDTSVTELPQPLLTANNISENPSFHITITPFLVGENAAGANVARVTGIFTEHTNIELLGPLTSNYYDAVRVDNNTFIIKLKAGITASDAAGHPLNIVATNDLQTTTITRHIDLNIAFENDPIVLTNEANPDYFSGTDGSYTVYNIAQEFHDPEGRIDHYTVTGTHANINTISIDNSGILTIDLNSGIASDDSFTFYVTAYASDGTFSTPKAFTYDVFTSTNVPSGFITGSDEYNTDAATINIIGTNSTVYADSDNASNTINIGGTGATVKAGGGNDTFNINDDGYTLYGESGDDTFNINNPITGTGFIYAGDGNDNVALDGTPAANLGFALPVTTVIDGGSGYDVLAFNDSGNIDFGGINNDVIKNFEEILTQNGATNTVSLTYNDVIAMTDHNNVLAINTDNMDTVNFNTGGSTFVQTGDVNQAGEDYHVFTDGSITLLVDTDTATVNII